MAFHGSHSALITYVGSGELIFSGVSRNEDSTPMDLASRDLHRRSHVVRRLPSVVSQTVQSPGGISARRACRYGGWQKQRPPQFPLHPPPGHASKNPNPP